MLEIKHPIPTKLTSALELPVIGLGTYGMGGEANLPIERNDLRDINSLILAISQGFTHLDTAERYADGRAESLIGEALTKVEPNSVFVTTKAWRYHSEYDQLLEAATSSRKRLGIKKIHLYLLHAYNPAVPLKETVRALDSLLEYEIADHIGVSNFNKPLLEEALSYTKYHIENNQIHYSLTAQAYEQDGTLEFCKKNNILITAYRIGGFKTQESLTDSLTELSKKYNKTPMQIALRWVIQQPNIVALIKASSQVHLAENLSTLDWDLSPEDLSLLKSRALPGITDNYPGYNSQK